MTVLDLCSAYEAIEVVSERELRAKPGSDFLEVYREAAIYCLLRRKKVILTNATGRVLEITPHQIIDAISD